MSLIPDESKGTEELETKVFGIDPVVLHDRLLAAGATCMGRYDMEDLHYMPTQQMIAEQLGGPRLRRITKNQQTDGELVELTIKRKFEPLCIPGYESLGPLLKRRIEYVLTPFDTVDNVRWTASETPELDWEPSHTIVTCRLHFELASTRFEIDRILTCNGSAVDLPPYLEIEAHSPEAIMQAAGLIGLTPQHFSPLSKREVIEQHRSLKR